MYGHGSHLGHVTWIIWINFQSPIPLRLHMKCGFNHPSGFSGKEVWKCWIQVTLDQCQWMIFIFDIHLGSCPRLVNCIYQFWYHRLQQFLKYPLFYLFPIQKHKGPNLTLPWNISKSTQSHHLNKLGRTQEPSAAFQLSMSSAVWFQRRRFFKIFTIYGHGGHISHVTWTIWTIYHSPIRWRLHIKFGFNRPSSF